MSWWDNIVDFGNAIYSGIQNVTQWAQDQKDKEKEEEQEVKYTPPTTTPTTDSGFTYKDFQTSDATNDYLNAFNNWKAQGAPVYVNSYQETLNGIMNDIMNGKPFSWDMNGDAMYQQYKDMYTNQANLGMQNAMAQAAALTGGYGSSYGQAVGQQAYAQQMQGLNDRALDLHDRAYGQYQDQRADLYNQYGMYSDLSEQEYNEWLNLVNLYNQEGDRLYGLYMDSYNNDLNTYNTDKGIAYDEYTTQQANARKDAEWEREYGDFERDENGNIVYDENGIPKGGGRQTRADWFAQQEANPNTTYEGEGMLNGQQVPKTLANVPGLTTINTKYFDESGNFIKASLVKENADDGTVTYSYGGKNIELKKGVNPYTNDRNPDVDNGTFSNGYQPNNVAGNKLSKTGITDYVNGVQQNVWKTEDGKMWIWDGTQNKYLSYEE